jgi:hypothetical protein
VHWDVTATAVGTELDLGVAFSSLTPDSLSAAKLGKSRQIEHCAAPETV